LIPQIARRDTNENEFDEAVTKMVNQMTRLVMASTANAWLIYLSGMARRHKVFTAEQLIHDMENFENLVYTIEDHHEVSQDRNEAHPLSLYLFSVPTLLRLKS
jgi:hypothetical protein